MNDRPTPDEAHDAIKAESSRDLQRILAEIACEPHSKRALRKAVANIMVIVTASRIGQYRKRFELEDRVTALEAIVKPRVRIVAPTRQVA